MSLEQIILTKNILLVLISVLLVVVLMNIDWKKGVSKVSDAGNDFAGRILRKSKLNYFNYYVMTTLPTTEDAASLRTGHKYMGTKGLWS